MNFPIRTPPSCNLGNFFTWLLAEFYGLGIIGTINLAWASFNNDSQPQNTCWPLAEYYLLSTPKNQAEVLSVRSSVENCAGRRSFMSTASSPTSLHVADSMLMHASSFFLLHHSHKVVVLVPSLGPSCLKFACSRSLSVCWILSGFFSCLPQSKKHGCEVNWKLLIVCRCKCECEWLLVSMCPCDELATCPGCQSDSWKWLQ